MRIIGGSFKGRTLKSLKGISVRPTTDRVKEAVFNLIQKYVSGAVVLDLFAGSGALGIEALSRGAAKVVFADRSKDSISVVKENLSKVSGDTEIILKDFRSAVQELQLSGEKFDIIFIDPPYKEGLYGDVLKLLYNSGILADGGIAIIERERGEKDYDLPLGLEIKESRDYGGTAIDIIIRASKTAITGTFDPFTKGHRYLVDEALEHFDYAHIVILENPNKTAEFSLKNRLKIIEKATKDVKKRVKIAYYSGLAIDYCRKNGIEYIIRGVRNDVDLKYEQEMAVWNLKEGGIQTILLNAEDSEISSTLVKKVIKEGGDLSGLVDNGSIREILKDGRKWKT